MRKTCLTGITLFFMAAQILAQKWLMPSDTLYSARVKGGVAGITGLYAGFSAGLYTAWYAQYPMSGFHTFNDWNEWRNMDKLGHAHSSYAHTYLVFTGARWAGMNRKNALLTGIASSLLLQNTIEIMDGFSEKWGFSVPDALANLTGTGLFACQEWLWQEQRIQVKFLPSDFRHSRVALPSLTNESVMISPDERADQLFGHGLLEQGLKDYNRHTYWLSFQIKPWLAKDNNWPAWLCLGLGVGAGNMYGGFSNHWRSDSTEFDFGNSFPRYSRFFAGPDIDLQKIGAKRPWLKTLFSVSKIFKIPLPCIEWNTRGEWIFHLLR